MKVLGNEFTFLKLIGKEDPFDLENIEDCQFNIKFSTPIE